MSRAHKTIATFLKNRQIAQRAFTGQNKEKPKEKQDMKPKKTNEAKVKIKQTEYKPNPNETIMNKDATPYAQNTTSMLVDLTGIVKKDKKVAEAIYSMDPRKDSAALPAVTAATNKTVDATGEADAKRTNTGAAEVQQQPNQGSKKIKDLMQKLGIKTEAMIKKQGKIISSYVGKATKEVPTPTPRAKVISGYTGKNVAPAKPKAGANIVDKSGAIHSPMSRARHLAQLGMQMAKLNPKLKETWSNAVLDQLDEYNAMATDLTRMAGFPIIRNHDKNKDSKPVEPIRPKQKNGKLPMTQAAAALSAEAVTYAGLGTDGANKALKAKADQHTEMALAANKAGDDAKVKHHQAQVAKIKAQMQTAQVKDYMEEVEELDEGKMKEIYTDMQDHAAKKGYSSHKQFKKADYESVGKKHGISGGDVAIVAGHHTADSYSKLKEENLDELKASTLQSYADKAHQQALDATYDAAHLNRTGEEKFKADAKQLASKRAGGVQRAQTKLDKMDKKMSEEAHLDEARGTVFDSQTRTWPGTAKNLKPAGHGIVGKKVRSYDFPGMHDSHYIEGHVTDEDPHSYHVRTTKVVRHHKEEPIPAHLSHVRAPKGLHVFGNAQGVYYAPKEQVKPKFKNLRNKK